MSLDIDTRLMLIDHECLYLYEKLGDVDYEYTNKRNVAEIFINKEFNYILF